MIEALHLPTRGRELLLDHVHPPLAPHLAPALAQPAAAQEGARSTPSPVPAGGSAAGSFDPENTRRRCPALVLAAIRVGSHSGHRHTDVLELQQPHRYCPPATAALQGRTPGEGSATGCVLALAGLLLCSQHRGAFTWWQLRAKKAPWEAGGLSMAPLLPLHIFTAVTRSRLRSTQEDKSGPWMTLRGCVPALCPHRSAAVSLRSPPRGHSSPRAQQENVSAEEEQCLRSQGHKNQMKAAPWLRPGGQTRAATHTTWGRGLQHRLPSRLWASLFSSPCNLPDRQEAARLLPGAWGPAMGIAGSRTPAGCSQRPD